MFCLRNKKITFLLRTLNLSPEYSVVSPIEDPGIVSLIPARSHMVIDHEIFSTVILLFPLIQEGLVSVTS